MKETEDHVHEQLDRLGTVARVCQACGLVEWLDGQEQGNRKPGERRKRHRSDATSWLGVEPQAVIRSAPQLGPTSSPDGDDFPHPCCRFIDSLDSCVSLSNALFFQAQPAIGWDTLDDAEGCDVTE